MIRISHGLSCGSVSTFASLHKQLGVVCSVILITYKIHLVCPQTGGGVDGKRQYRMWAAGATPIVTSMRRIPSSMTTTASSTTTGLTMTGMTAGASSAFASRFCNQHTLVYLDEGVF